MKKKEYKTEKWFLDYTDFTAEEFNEVPRKLTEAEEAEAMERLEHLWKKEIIKYV